MSTAHAELTAALTEILTVPLSSLGAYTDRAEVLAEFVRAREAEAIPRRFAEHLVHNSLGSRCELTSFVDSSRCSGEAVAIRWEAGFADDVCQDHAETAIKRGAAVVFARHHDGTEGS